MSESSKKSESLDKLHKIKMIIKLFSEIKRELHWPSFLIGVCVALIIGCIQIEDDFERLLYSNEQSEPEKTKSKSKNLIKLENLK